ncbi:methyltransferase domain-containing protein [Actinomadura formosensis]|uniref:methyltransferase domain-containing protein n=1 Tax=Actinomadura formosensis TaxID=60706 RepID=UPI000A0288F4|nr:methyltransferase domain-containing protein [Actinomadura formosensis]
MVTQLDGGTAPSDVSEPVPGEPTSSSTLPGLVVLMLERLDVTEGMNVLEIGTGTGYSTALMCDRLGYDNVTSVELDPDVAAKAAAALRRLGHAPHLVVGDGLEGDDNRAPFDRVIATCSVRRIPSAWLRQTRPGGRILTTLGGWLHGYGLALLDVSDDGAAEGRYLPGTISFMMARPQAPPMIDDARWNEVSELLTRAEPRPAVVDMDIQQDWTGRFVMQLALPCVLQRAISVDGGPWTEYLIDVTTGSSASLTPEPGGGWTVRQAGPVRLWDEAEKAIGRWRDAGAPAQDEFRVRTDGHEQTVWFDTDDGPVSWTLGAQDE